jgi:carboxyl-terminal processing protease
VITKKFAYAAELIVMVTLVTTQLCSQISSFDRGRAEEILQVISSDVRRHYYDPKFHGVDFDAKVAEAKQKVDESKSFNMAMSHIAAALDSLNDSHTFFLPPQHSYRHSYGLLYQMVGDRCFVTQVRPGSDAADKGVKPGDEILTLNGYTPTRNTMWKMQYLFSVLRPQVSLRLRLQDPLGTQREVEIMAKMQDEKRIKELAGNGGDLWDVIRNQETEKHLMRSRTVEYGGQVLVLKVPEFLFSIGEVESMLAKARKYPNLIVDLRGNPGGAIDTLKYLIGAMFDKEIKIADRIGRNETKPEVAKPLHNPYLGKLVVLVDSRSASAAELFARVIQLEKRGTVLGDVTSGAVMEAKRYSEKAGFDTVIFYGASITEWDLRMTDGKSLEHVGITPDEQLLPNASALAAGHDPVLVRAAQSLGVQISSEEAGKAFPYEWPPE